MQTVLLIVSFLLNIYSVLLLLRALASWVRLDPYSNELIRLLYAITEPVLEPIRSILPQTGIDFSPMIAMILTLALNRALSILAASL